MTLIACDSVSPIPDEPVIPPSEETEEEHDYFLEKGQQILNGMVLSKITHQCEWNKESSWYEEFKYDSYGRLVNYKMAYDDPNFEGASYYEVKFDYAKNELKIYEEDCEYTGEIKFNKNGYLTQLSFWNNQGEKIEKTYIFEYEDGVHLSEVEYSLQGEHLVKQTDYYRLNWLNNDFIDSGLLGSSWSVIGINYGTSHNKFGQYSHNIVKGCPNFLLQTGFLGKGPSREITELRYYSSMYDYTHSLVQTFSQDGRLIRENYDEGFDIREYEYKTITLQPDGDEDDNDNDNKNNNDNDDNDNNVGNDDSNITKSLLCKNKGLWTYVSSYPSNTVGYTGYVNVNDYVWFYENGDIDFVLDYINKGKDYVSGYYTHTSTTSAMGTYTLKGNVLQCVFTHVSCLGDYSLNHTYWTDGETNIKNFTVKYEEDENRITLTSGEEEYFFYQNEDNSNEGGDGNVSNEKPEIYFEDFTLGTNYITVKYRIGNKDKCGSLSNAKVYYGTSSASTSVSATLSGSLITAKITGLTKSTKYKIKCSVTGSTGTSTSSEIQLSTLAN